MVIGCLTSARNVSVCLLDMNEMMLLYACVCPVCVTAHVPVNCVCNLCHEAVPRALASSPTSQCKWCLCVVCVCVSLHERRVCSDWGCVCVMVCV